MLDVPVIPECPCRLNQPRRWANVEAMSYVLPGDVDERPVSVIGGGTLGRRIATMLSLGRLARGRKALRRRARVLCLHRSGST
jgi:hypothetical protein